MHDLARVSVALWLGFAPVAAAQQGPPLVPAHVPLDPSAQAAIDAEWATDAEHRDLRVFHGVWDERDLDSPARRALAALNAWDFDDPALANSAVAPEIRAEAMVRRGDLPEALALLDGVSSNRAARLRAQAYESLGDQDAALAAVEAPVRQLTRERTEDAAALTEGVRALFVRSRLEGQPARDYQTMVALLARAHQELDRLYWPARLAEAQLLIDKDNEREAVDALHETLALNPRCADAWFILGRLALQRFDFGSAELAEEHLRRLNPDHPLADLLVAEARLIHDDPDGAMLVLEPLIERLPRLREALALAAAAAALQYDDEALAAALAVYETLSPRSAKPYAVVGRHLSLNRQYEAAADALNEAIRRQPAWPEPRIELGLMELQSGRDAVAMEALEEVVRLDPFNRRATNSLFLLQELATYRRIETEHFVIRYQPGIDEVMVQLMPGPLERLHERVSSRFHHEPDRKTVIEVLPDHERFAVRITGMPWIHTIAASTGPVIALEVPREGPPSLYKGPFDWARVLQHEYTHTITLSLTRNRIPHWLTEAAAVSMEDSPRDYDTCLMLAAAYRKGELFDLDEIKWAFVRPRRPGDRGLAYAQSHWMVEYMDERFGESALVRLLGQYFEGVREQEAMPQALGVSREEFFEGFLEWAGPKIASWGIEPVAPTPTLDELEDQLRWADPELAEMMVASQQARLDAIARTLADRVGRPSGTRAHRERFTADHWPELIRPAVVIDDATLAGWLDRYPNQPDLLEIFIRRSLRDVDEPDPTLVDLLEHYARVRPVDPFPHQVLARFYLASPEPEAAIEHLEELDAREQKSPVFALQLADLYRREGRVDEALQKVTRAVQINPYHAANRERAAAIAIEAGRLDLARMHIVALTLLEPGQPQHSKRLAAIDRLLSR